MVTYKYSRFSADDSLPIAVKFMPKGTSVAGDFHNHEFSEIVVITAGTATHRIGQAGYAVGQGDVLLISPNCTHAYEDTGELELVNIIYDAQMMIPGLKSCRLPFITKLFPINYPDNGTMIRPVMNLDTEAITVIVKLAERLDFEARHLIPGRQVLLLSIFMEIIIYLARYSHPIGEIIKFPDGLKAAISYINQHYAEKFSITNLQKIARMSERNLFRSFKRAFGVSPNQYLQNIRVQHAYELLLSTNKSIGEIALDCGFCDSNHFGKVFKNIMHDTPGKIRTQHKGSSHDQ